MKGMVFTEFLEMVEDKFGFTVANTIIENSDLPSGGAYTSVGTYDYREMLEMVQQLSNEIDVPVYDLVKVFGEHLFNQLARNYSYFFPKDQNAFAFLEGIDNYIHVEVRKLYPDAELPSFECQRPDPNTMILNYKSPRPFGDLALGLLEGCVKHFDEPISIQRQKLEHAELHAERFTLTHEGAA